MASPTDHCLDGQLEVVNPKTTHAVAPWWGHGGSEGGEEAWWNGKERQGKWRGKVISISLYLSPCDIVSDQKEARHIASLIYCSMEEDWQWDRIRHWWRDEDDVEKEKKEGQKIRKKGWEEKRKRSVQGADGEGRRGAEDLGSRVEAGLREGMRYWGELGKP